MSDCSAKQALLRAAIDIVADGGLNNFSMKKVTNHIGVSEALIYKHFQTKDHLLDCCFESIHTQIGTALSGLELLSMNFEQHDLYQAIRLYWMLYFDYLVKHGNDTLFYFAYRDSSYIKDVQSHDEEAKQSYFKAFVDFFKQVDSRLHIYQKTSSDHLWTYILDTSGIFAKRVIRGELPNTPESIENIWQLIFGGITGLIQP